MKRFGDVAFLVPLGVLVLVAGAAAQDQREGFDQEAMMKEWMVKYALPAEEHDYLSYFEGDWKVESTMYMGPTPEVSEGTSHMELAMGGRYLHASHSSEMNGMPFEGHGITGYDRVSGEFFNIWLDNMGTGFMEGRGHALKTGKGHEVSGTMKDPLMGGDTSFRMVTTVVDDDRFKFDMYMTPPGQEESKAMEITYTRQKSS